MYVVSKTAHASSLRLSGNNGVHQPSKREGYNPTISVKCQMTGPRKVRCWSPEMTRIEDDFDWNQVTVVPIVELRGIWRQNHQYGPTIDVTDMLVFSNDDGMCPFTLE